VGILSRCGATGQAFVEEGKKAGSQLLLSALFTTTMVAQEATIEALKEAVSVAKKLVDAERTSTDPGRS